MARPATSVKVNGVNKRNKATVLAREAAEDKLRGSTTLSACPPARLSASQGELYRFLHKALSDAGVLSVLDREVLATAAVTLDRLARIDDEIEARGDEGLLDRGLCTTRDVYFKQASKVMSELCLSPAARAKLGAAIAQQQKEARDPLLDALGVN